MSGRHPFSDLTTKFEPRLQAHRCDEEMLKHGFRRVSVLTQKDVANAPNVNQPAVAKLE